jgi:hypothetical protein
MKNKFWYKLSDVNQELNILREKGLTRGKEVGFPFERLGISIKKGCTTYIAGAPGDGKSEFWLEMLLNLSCLYGWRHVVFTPETGDAAQIFAELCHKYIGKHYSKTSQNPMNDTEKTRAEYFISEHFYVIDPIDDVITLEDYYKQVDDLENDLGIAIDTTTIDPFNEIKHEGASNRQDLIIEDELGFCRRNARKKKRHNCLITHVRDQPIVEKEGVRYCPMPTAREFSGGQAWFRKGEQMVIVWRPPSGVKKDTGDGVYSANEVVIKVAKEKPKGASKKGSYIFYYDKDRNAYYYMDGDAKRFAKRGQEVIQETIKKVEEPKIEETFHNNSTLKQHKPSGGITIGQGEELPW